MAAPVWHVFVDEFITGEQNSAIQGISKGLLDGDLTLVELIEGLGSHLTNTEKHVRGRATRLLSELLHRIPHEQLSAKEVDVIVAFYCDRIKDHHSVTPHVLYGMLALSQMSSLSDEAAVRLVRHIFSEVHVQSLVQGDRRHVFSAICNLLNSHLEGLKSMGGDFVCGYIQAMDAEKDPRNLLICFNTVPVIAQQFPIEAFREDLFEVVGCYFPIDFTPPPNDPHGVRREQLIEGLRRSLAATPGFAEFGVPLLIEKLTSSSGDAKIDSLQTLAVCAPVYGSDGLQEFMGTLIFNTRREVFSATSEQLEEAALSLFTAISSTLSAHMSQVGKATALESFLSDLYGECRHHLCEPELKLMYPSAKCLWAASEGSAHASQWMLAKSVPLLLEQFHKHPQANLRRNIVDILLNFIRTATKVCKGEQVVGSIQQWKSELLGLCVTLLSDTTAQLRQLAIQGLTLLTQLTGLLTEEEVQMSTEHIADILLRDQDETVRDAGIAGLREMVSNKPNLVLPVLPKFTTPLTQAEKEAMETNTWRPSNVYLLTCLSSLSCHLSIIQSTQPLVLDHLEQLSSRPLTAESLSEGVSTCHCLQSMVADNVKNVECQNYFTDTLIPHILSLLVKGALSHKEEALLAHVDVVEALSAVIRTVISHSPPSSAFLTNIYGLFCDGDVSFLKLQDVDQSAVFRPLELTSDVRQSQLVSVLLAVLGSAPLLLEPNQQKVMQDKLWLLSLRCCRNHANLAAMKCYAAVINRIKADIEVTDLLASLKPELLDLIVEHTKLRALHVWNWLTKALVLRGHKAQNEFIDKILEWLADLEIGETAADGFRVILHEFDDVMSPPQHANIKLMHRQRFFLYTCPHIIDGFNKAHASCKHHYLTALSHLLKYVPKQVLMGELPNLLPLLVQSLSVDEVSLQLATMTTLTDLLQHDAEQLAPHSDDILPRLLKLAQYKPNMKLRIAALKCIGLMSTLPRHIVYRHQPEVTRSLGVCIDDHKRLVRREAVNARTVWFLMETVKR